jgi:hypothetical protein
MLQCSMTFIDEAANSQHAFLEHQRCGQWLPSPHQGGEGDREAGGVKRQLPLKRVPQDRAEGPCRCRLDHGLRAAP